MKKCFKCEIEKPLSEFYKHKKMADGYINKCKSCTKIDSIKRYNELSKDQEWVEKERKRSREKYRRLNYKEKYKDKSHRPWADSHVIKNLSRKFGLPKGVECHHWSYNDEHLEDVFFLERKIHKNIHRYLILDYDTRFFRTTDGELLNTKQKHKEYIESFNLNK